MAVPPLAEMPSVVLLAMVPPSTATGPPQVSPTPMALPALPPLLTSPIATAPPLADAVATPPLPALAISTFWAAAFLRLTAAYRAPTTERAPATRHLTRCIRCIRRTSPNPSFSRRGHAIAGCFIFAHRT
jgi:hypothetical protein